MIYILFMRNICNLCLSVFDQYVIMARTLIRVHRVARYLEKKENERDNGLAFLARKFKVVREYGNKRLFFENTN